MTTGQGTGPGSSELLMLVHHLLGILEAYLVVRARGEIELACAAKYHHRGVVENHSDSDAPFSNCTNQRVAENHP